VKEKDNWKKIDCMNGKEIMTPEKISEIIWQEVSRHLKK
jgi:hypothetical protein